MTLFWKPAHITFPLFLTLILAIGAFSQDNFQRGASVTLPDELRRFASVHKTRPDLAEQIKAAPGLERGFPQTDLLQAPASIKPVPDKYSGVGTFPPEPKAQSVEPDRFRMGDALKQSMIMLAVQHGFRLTQGKTRRELGGPFFEDWGRSVKGFRGWRDSDNTFTNYVAHPLQGATTGRIYVTNSRIAESAEFGSSRKYWLTRLEAMAWSAFWSAQFELGPISEASIGNVGMTKKNGKGTMGWVDMVMTPTAGTAILVGEDVLEKYVLKRMLRQSGGRVTTKIKIWRSLLTPSYSVTNLLSGKPPWSRRSNFTAAVPPNASPDTGQGSPSIQSQSDRDR